MTGQKLIVERELESPKKSNGTGKIRLSNMELWRLHNDPTKAKCMHVKGQGENDNEVTAI